MQACNDSNGHFCSAVYLADKGEHTVLYKIHKHVCIKSQKEYVIVLYFSHTTHTHTHTLVQVCAQKECNREGWRGKEAKKGGDSIEIICCGIVCRGVLYVPE